MTITVIIKIDQDKAMSLISDRHKNIKQVVGGYAKYLKKGIKESYIVDKTIITIR